MKVLDISSPVQGIGQQLEAIATFGVSSNRSGGGSGGGAGHGGGSLGGMRGVEDDDRDAIPFQGLDKGLVLQEKRIFGDPKVKPRKCAHLLTKILYLVNSGTRFTKKEATDVFFSVTKLFQSKELQLRRLVYLVLKELAPLAEQDHVIIVVASLTKDMNSKIETYRANAIRVLCRITEVSLLQQVERLLKQAVVDKDPYVSSAALVSTMHLIRVGPDIVRRWVSEVQQALSSRNHMVQYHALGLMHAIKRHDRLAVSKLVSSLSRDGQLRSAFAHCLLIRFATQIMNEEMAPDERRQFFGYLEACLRHKSEIVIYEAARAICSLSQVSARELTPAITVLQLFLSSPKAALRFAAVRTLNRVAMTHPLSVTPSNLDLENLITDVNRSIATLAITTLLRTGSAASVDRLMKQITSFMSDITDEFKVVVVDAIRALAVKFPEKHRSLMGFLSGALRDEGGFPFKKAIVEAILDIIRAIPEAKDVGLTHLCEFIEDCEFAFLSCKILHVLGAEGPASATPAKFIRYIYNRISLENASVRASAVSALAKFGARVPELRPAVRVLLNRCLFDSDDEVRDRSTFFLNLLAPDTPTTFERVVLGGDDVDADGGDLASAEGVSDAVGPYLLEPLAVPVINMEQALLDYVQAGDFSTPFDPSAVSQAAPRLTPAAVAANDALGGVGGGLLNATREAEAGAASGSAASLEAHAKRLADVPELAALAGQLFRSSPPVALTESETEYVVRCIKHVFADKQVVLQFDCNNTLPDQLLEKVSVAVVPADPSAGVRVRATVPVGALPYGEPGTCYVVLAAPAGELITDSFSATLKFRVRDVDPQTGEPDDQDYADEYQLEDVEVAASDYARPTFVSDFGADWGQLAEHPDCAEVVETYALTSAASLSDAVGSIIGCLGLQPAEGSDQVPEKKKKHILCLAGRFAGDVPVLVRVRMRLDPSGAGVAVEVTVRATDEAVAQTLANAVG